MSASRAPRMVLAALYTLPVLELVVLIMVGRRFGAAPVLLAVLLSSMLGVSVIRRAGSGAMRDLAAARTRMAAGGAVTVDPEGRTVDAAGTPIGTADPVRPPGDRLVLGLAGLLLVIPGLIGSVLGLVLLVPGVRSLVRAGARRLAGRRGWVEPPAQVRVISVEELKHRNDPEA